ncbi:MAG: allophanate hydrolase [Ferruginibacter sp.]|nr:allophanate hydrolase [Ferruginibacter sp.]
MPEVNFENNNVRITPLSDRSVLISFGNVIDPSINERVLSIHKALLQNGFDGFIESVPAYASLAVFYDVIKIQHSADFSAFLFVKEFLDSLVQRINSFEKPTSPIKVIPVCYDAEYGFDITYVAGVHRLSIPEVISLHTSVIYRVYMIGFMPGFAYMGAVADELATPRKDNAQLIVPAGSVGIAGAQTGIYPIDSPGGWQIIGRTPLRIFDVVNVNPCLLAAGDQVQFVSIDKNEFASYVD